MRRRLDQELVRRGLVASREQAQEAVSGGRVLVGGALALKASRQVDASEAVELVGPPRRFVGRGGDKLDAALERFAIPVAGRRALDAGASTGGFTDCLLQRGATGVVALDVGHGQLHERLRADPRVINRERTNIRHVTADELGGPFALVVADLSFISLRTAAASLVALAEPDGDLIVLVKPQFEAGRADVSRGAGVVRDPSVWHSALVGVVDAMAAAGAAMMGLMVSPLRGAEGNVEFLLWLKAGATGEPALAGTGTPADVVGQVVRDALGPAARGER